MKHFVDEKKEQKMSSSQVRTDSIKLLGDRLLMGWVMLAEACDQCHVPLVENRRSSQPSIVCVSCNAQFARADDGYLYLKTLVSSQANLEQQQQQQQQHEQQEEQQSQQQQQQLQQPNPSFASDRDVERCASILESTTRVLYQKMDELKTKLLVETNLQNGKQIGEFIAVCVSALLQLKKLEKLSSSSL